jgi:limonene-1,2-epoxide hydrolase
VDARIAAPPDRGPARSRARVAAVLALLLIVGLTGCGGRPSPASVVRSWSSALNAGDNERAADLFARGAEVVQGGTAFRLESHADAVAWNSALPCTGKIVQLSAHGETVTATFVLGDRTTSACDGPGRRAGAVFRVRRGKIVLWHQVQTPAPPSGEPA